MDDLCILGDWYGQIKDIGYTELASTGPVCIPLNLTRIRSTFGVISPESQPPIILLTSLNWETLCSVNSHDKHLGF
jgi:hypothetical protein